MGELAEQGSDDEMHLNRPTLLRALAQLTQHQRAIVALRYLDDFSNRDTATILGCSSQSVTTESARALTRLGRFQHDGQGGDPHSRVRRSGTCLRVDPPDRRRVDSLPGEGLLTANRHIDSGE